MGLMSNLKKILFDEVDVEIPVRNDEIPSSNEHKKSNTGFIDHTNDIERKKVQEFDVVEKDDDDTIKEVIVPKEEETRRTSEYSFPIINDYDTPEVKTRSKAPVVEEEVKKSIQPRRDYRALVNNNSESEHNIKKYDEKDYRKLLERKMDNKPKEKKPFTVTPVISPVYGIIKETEEMSREYITIPKEETVKKESVLDKYRSFGPVSYNEPNVVSSTKVTNVESTKYTQVVEQHKPVIEETKEIPHRTLDNYMDNLEENLDKIYDDIEIPASKVEEDVEISSPDYDNLDGITSGIENEYINSDNLDEELDDNEDEIVEDVQKTEDVINETKKSNYDDEDAHLDDTIETDLFNLIDSMYKDDEEVEE